MTESRLKNWMACLTLAAIMLPAGSLRAQPSEAANPLIDWPMSADPTLVEAQAPSRYHPRQVGIWMQALNQPDTQTRYQTALAIARNHRAGMPGLEITAGRLHAILADAKEHALTRIAAADALLAINAQEHAPAVWTASGELGYEMARVISPALAQLKYAPALEVWRKTAGDATQSLTNRRLAVDSLALAGDAAAAAVLHALAIDASAPSSLRLAAARAYAKTARAGDALPALPDADAKVGQISTLVRVNLLSAHQNPQAYRLLAELLKHSDPTVSHHAASILLQHAPDQLDGHLSDFARSGDVGLRRIALTRWTQLSNDAAVAGLSGLLEDMHPAVRTQATTSLIELGKKSELQARIHEAVLNVLRTGQPAGREQAALLAGELKINAAAQDLVKLLDHESAAVGLASATALRKLQLPETLDAALENLVKNSSRSAGNGRDEQAAQLIQLMGLVKHQPADAALRKLIPKNAGPLKSRQAAIWALGHLHAAGKPDNQLVSQFNARINDTRGMEPEDEMVRVHAIIAIGRMKAANTLSAMRKLHDDPESSTIIAAATRWTLAQLTGSELPVPVLPVQTLTGGFLDPID